MPSYHTRLFLCLAHIAAQTTFRPRATAPPPRVVWLMVRGLGGQTMVRPHLAPLFAQLLSRYINDTRPNRRNICIA